MNTFMRRWGMNFHFILWLVEDAWRCAEIGANILAAVAEENITNEALLSGFKRANGALGKYVESKALGAAGVSNDSRRFDVELLQHTGDWEWWRFRVLHVVAAVQRHFGDDGRVARAKVKRSKPMTSEVCLHFAVNHVKVKRQSSKVQCERVLGSIVHRWMSGSERILDLLNRRQNLLRVE